MSATEQNDFRPYGSDEVMLEDPYALMGHIAQTMIALTRGNMSPPGLIPWRQAAATLESYQDTLAKVRGDYAIDAPPEDEIRYIYDSEREI